MKKLKSARLTGIFVFMAFALTVSCPRASALPGGECKGLSFCSEASYYTRESCIKESGQCTMANGKELDDGKATFASWDFKFGTKLLIECNGRKVVAVCTDRGPAKRLYRKGRKLDLSKKTFESLAPIKVGLIEVVATVIQ